MEKFDLKAVMKPYWSPPKRFSVIEVPSFTYLMIDGRGDPNTAPAYANAVQWLFSLSYTLKFMSKGELARDYGVAPLEGLWWTDDEGDFAAASRDDWYWTAMVMQPEWITPEMVSRARTKVAGKLGDAPESLRLAPFEEGLCVQIMHIGPYSAEAPTILALHSDFLPANGLIETGHHHEIYLNDPRRTAPDKLKTVIRQPVRRK